MSQNFNLIHEAVLFAEKAHRGQRRKGTEVAYITHPMEVMQILASMKADPELLAAGVLHDTVEDTGVSIEDIRSRFGNWVARIVESHSEEKGRPWQERKQHTIDALLGGDRDIRLLIMADMVANLRSMLSDYSRMGSGLWERFNAPRALQAWYYGEAQDALYDMQFDEDTRQVYWEMVALYKELFVDYYIYPGARTIYQISCGGQGYVFRQSGNIWEPFNEPLPEEAMRLTREEAELLEDSWNEERLDDSVAGNEETEEAVAHCCAGKDGENAAAVLRIIWQRVIEGGHWIVPVEFRGAETPDGRLPHYFEMRKITIEGGSVAAAAFTSRATMTGAPDSALLSLSIGDFLRAVYEKPELEGVVLNPWNGAFFLDRDTFRLLLEDTEVAKG